METDGTHAAGSVAAVTLLVTRGILLWLVIPFGFISWICASRWMRVRQVSLGQFLGWVDNNLVAGLQRSALRPLFRDPPQPWVRVRDIPHVRRRIDVLSLL